MRPAEAPPPVPTGLLPATRGYWRMLWGSRLATVWDRETDLIGLRRYIENLDAWLRYKQVVRQSPLVKGSKGQIRSNPLAARMDALEKQLHWTEEQYGLTPVARVRLGIEYATGLRSAAALPRRSELHEAIARARRAVMITEDGALNLDLLDEAEDAAERVRAEWRARR